MYKRIINIAPSTLTTEVHILIRLDTSNFDYTHVGIKGEDLRFYNSIDNTLLEHYIEKWNPIDESIIWVKVKSTTDSIYMQYGETLPSISNPNAFLLFDHFDDNVVDTLKWNLFEGGTESGTELNMTGTTTNGPRLHSINKYGMSALRFSQNLHIVAKGMVFLVATWIGGNAAEVGIHYEWTTPDKHVARTRNVATLPIVTNITIPDYNGIYGIFDILYSPSNHTKFYIDNILVTTVFESITTPLPSTSLNLIWGVGRIGISTLIPTNILIDWIHVRNYDGNDYSITIGTETTIIPCSTPVYTLILT